MFRPKYVITNKLLANIKKISSIIIELNNRRFQKVVLYELEKKAREVSTYTSTSIEGNPLSLTDVKQIIKNRPENLRDSEQEIINYNDVLEELNINLQKRSMDLDIDMILSIHRKIVNKLIPKYQIGKLRKEPVFVNDPKTGKTIYWPPDHGEIAGLINDLLEFVTKNKGIIDPLIVAGIFHKQFVIIHPFMDGNGRTARICTKAIMANIGLDTFNLFSFENYYNRNVTKYFNNVGVSGNYYDITELMDFTRWLEYFADGIIDELLRVKKLLLSTSAGPTTKLFPYHEKIIKYIEEKGFINDKDYSRLTERAKATRSLDFKKLIDLDFIERKGKGRSTYYILKEK
jgi:Fic family protein